MEYLGHQIYNEGKPRSTGKKKQSEKQRYERNNGVLQMKQKVKSVCFLVFSRYTLYTCGLPSAKPCILN